MAKTLLDKHCVAEAKEAIPRLDGLPVCVHHLIARSKRRDKHHERGARHMEVGDKGIYHVIGASRHEVEAAWSRSRARRCRRDP